MVLVPRLVQDFNGGGDSEVGAGGARAMRTVTNQNRLPILVE
jgi:hypothetical protein